jgi:hypothetical protein
MEGLPFDSRRAVLPNALGRVLTAAGEQSTLEGVYVSGWLKRGPSGIVGAKLLSARHTGTASSTVPALHSITKHHTAPQSTTQHHTASHSITQHRTASHSTAQHLFLPGTNIGDAKETVKCVLEDVNGLLEKGYVLVPKAAAETDVRALLSERKVEVMTLITPVTL